MPDKNVSKTKGLVEFIRMVTCHINNQKKRIISNHIKQIEKPTSRESLQRKFRNLE